MADPEDREAGPHTPGASDPSSLDTTTDEPDAAGETTERWIGAYRVLGLLGAGGMGDVFLAFDSRLRRRVAIKRIRSDAAVSARAQERLRREAAAAAALSHPAIVHVYDILTDESGDAIVMEYVEGETLAAVSARGALPLGQAVRIGRQVAEGLAAAHAIGLIHRDLKTQNVMVTPSGQAKILDFGLVKRPRQTPDEDTLTGEGSLLGTVRSMSPEQAQGRELDARSDLFSLGVMLYEICTGRPPFHADSPTQTLLQLVAGPPPPIASVNPDVPPPLTTLIDQLLEKDPQRRPGSAADVAVRLAGIESLSRFESRDPPAATTASSRRSPSKRTLAAVGVLLLAVSFGVFGIRQRSTPARAVAVLVTEPALASPAPDERTRLAAFAIREAIVRALAGLEGLEPVGSDEVPADPLTLPETVRAAAADEVVVPAIDCEGPSCRVSVRRQRGSDLHIVANSKPFDVSSEPEDSLALTSAVAINIREIFADHRLRTTSKELELRSDDFQRYLAFRKRAANGEVLTKGDVEELERLAQTSPGLFEARLLAASSARALKERTTALRILREASARDQEDPRLAQESFQIELETGTVADAERALAVLEARVPGDLGVLRGRARLLLRQGKVAEAVEVRRRLLRERRSWRNLWSVANLEIDLGDEKGAREHLRQLLEMSPRNPRGRAKLAELEWFLGDPAQAARIYRGLLEEQETQQNVANLGWSLLLAGAYSDAVGAYRRALELRPEDLRCWLNLGIAHEGLGDAGAARLAYREVLDRLVPRERKGSLTPSERLLKAQALARLGDPVQAVELTMQALNEGDRSSQEIFQAALIYALCGDPNHAIVYARQARPLLSGSWFRIPGFESVRAMPAFRELLAP